MVKLRILVADDHAVVRNELRHLVEKQSAWEVCGEASTGREAVEMAMKLKPDIVVMDMSMPELNGLEATRQIRNALPRIEILILTMHQSEQLVRQVLAAGARGYLLKSDAGNALVAAVECLQKRKPYFTSEVSEMVLSGYLNPEKSGAENSRKSEELTPREREIVQLVAEGKSSKEIATALKISVKTAETHRSNLMRKLKFHSVSEVVRYAIRNKIIEA